MYNHFIFNFLVKKIDKILKRIIIRLYSTIVMTLYFFDWDDTLFPTTFYEKNKNNIKYFKHKFEALENSIICLFKKSLQFADVYIMSNASFKWINLCINKYCPRIKPFLIFIKDIISARDRYSASLPNDSSLWK